MIARTFLMVASAAVLACSIGAKAAAMSAACYFDRRPGGCYETARKAEHAREQFNSEYQTFLSLMQQVPHSAVPQYCRVGPDPRNGYATMAPDAPITHKQIQICIKAGNAWVAHEHEQERQKDKAYEKAARWVKIKAANGAEYAIDLGNVGRTQEGIVYARMCQVDVDGHHCVGGIAWAMYMRILWFDCRGHYADVTHPYGVGWQIAPPYSVIGRASKLACEKAQVLPNGHQAQ